MRTHLVEEELHIQLLQEDRVHHELGAGNRPSSLPDGSGIIFEQHGRIMAFDLPEGPLRPLSEGPDDRSPVVHPTSGEVAYERVVSRRRIDVRVVAADGSTDRAVTTEEGGREPSWWV